jgi:CheY-like chemotaxis protein
MTLMGATTSKRRGGSAAAVLDFAVAKILGDDAALGALPAVLDRMVAAFGLRAALAFQPSGSQPSVLAVYPPGAADQALLARIGVMAMAQRDSAPVPLAVPLEGQPGSVLVARSVPVEGQCLCALAGGGGARMKGRVLVIEDDQDISLGIRTVLSRQGLEVDSSPDGKQGLRAFHLARPEPFDLVVLDIGLPAMDGWAVLERIRDLSDGDRPDRPGTAFIRGSASR